VRISVVIITLNEEKNIAQCLDSVNWADEVIVFDSDSVDRTVEIARSYGATVHVESKWYGFGVQKNKATELAQGDWILSLDADERVSENLADEIKNVTSNSEDLAGIEIPRLSSYCGRFMRYGGWWPDYTLRLFRRGCGNFSENLVHEKMRVNGKIGRLKNHIIHHSFESVEEVLDKVNKYSSLGAEQMAKNGIKAGISSALLHGIAAFVKTYILKGAFLEGRFGLMLSISNAEGSYYKYLKLMLLKNK